MKNFLKNNWFKIITILGTIIVSHSIFNFSFGSRSIFSDSQYYYYSEEILRLIAFGFGLIATGIAYWKCKK